nr:ankyrin-1-like [Ipomoea batatas]
MSPTYFPLRWESTGDQWWFASPIDWAAANGHYDLVRELLRLDSNHLFKLTSLRRIRRLETVWDDEAQFHDVAKCRSQVARKLLVECENKKGKNSLIRGGCGGWLLYTAASAGDLSFVQELLERDPLLVFGEGEYGVTDILYAAARSKNSDVFRILFDYAVSPRFLSGIGKELEEHVGDIPSAYKWEIQNRALHAAARGGNLGVLRELLADYCGGDHVLAYRDIQGATILHAAAARGQVEVVKDLIACYDDIISSTDNHGNTALHVAAARGQLAVVEALTVVSPSLLNSTNKAGETFLHVAVTGFQTPCFRRLDRQIELMKQLVSGRIFNIEEIVNAKNNDGRTALHLAIIGNIHSELVELLMTVRSMDVNTRDKDGMTPLDILRQRPRSESSEIITRQLISAGGIFSQQEYAARRVVASHLRMQSMGGSPGTSFRISDPEIFLYTGIENASDGSEGLNTFTTEASQRDSTVESLGHRSSSKPAGPANYATQRLKSLLQWAKIKKRDTERHKKKTEEVRHQSPVDNNSDGTPIPLRQRFSKPSSLPNNKRSLCVRSNLPSPTAKKRFASGLINGVMQAMNVPRRSSRSSSLSISSLSSLESSSVDKQKAVHIESEIAGGGGGSYCNEAENKGGERDPIEKQHGNRRSSSSVNQYFCFGGPPAGAGAGGQGLKGPPAGLMQPFEIYERSVLSTA